MLPICKPETSGKCHDCTLLDQLHAFGFFSLIFFLHLSASTYSICTITCIILHNHNLYNHFIPKIRNFNFYGEEETISFACLYKFCTRKLVIK